MALTMLSDMQTQANVGKILWCNQDIRVQSTFHARSAIPPSLMLLGSCIGTKFSVALIGLSYHDSVPIFTMEK